ncbi:MAG: GAF domain-containing protein [bacterium]|nr:GAF domain-containing protein [bacterium]
MPTTMVSTRFPLHATLTAAFATMFLLLGASIIGFSDWQNRKATLVETDELVDRMSSHMRDRIAGLYQPTQALVDVLAMLGPDDIRRVRERPRSLEALTESLEGNPAIPAIFFGYSNGDFLLVRSLIERASVVEKLDAPDGAAFVVQAIDHAQSPEGVENLYFLSRSLDVIEDRPVAGPSLDPRQRDWYVSAHEATEQITTPFYHFFTTGEVGVTFARRLTYANGVVGADLALGDLSNALENFKITPSTRVAIVEADLSVIAASTAFRPSAMSPGQSDVAVVKMPRLDELEDLVLRRLAKALAASQSRGGIGFKVDGESWMTAVSPLPTREKDILLAMAIPRAELLAQSDRIRSQSVVISLLMLGLSVAVIVWISRNVSRSIRNLAQEAEHIRRFRFDRPSQTRSRITEVDELASTMAIMKSSITKFFEISIALSAEKNATKLMEMILREACTVSHADGGAVLLRTEDEAALELAVLENHQTGVHLGGTSGKQPDLDPVSLATPNDPGAATSVDTATVELGEPIRIDDLTLEEQFDITEVRDRFELDGSPTHSLLSLPLADQQGQVIGLLQLVNAREPSGQIAGFDPEVLPHLEALCADAAVALDLRRLLQAQKDLLESFIHVVAGAIDAKSPYTHGHCQRVPILARMLAEAAHEVGEGPLAEFSLTDDEWYELHIASWLHDCGKVTTPEYVVDKATRLETNYNRLHEIRTRFEVLWRDAELECSNALVDDPSTAEATRTRLQERLHQIADDWQFVAECNLGETFMDEDRRRRLEQIASQTWVRHLDDRVGLSHEELRRKERQPQQDLPVTETLLADRAEHIIERPGSPFGGTDHDFRMEVPEHLYHLGELYNLSIQRGTLTTEERFKINEHIIQTINMLGKLPFPRELRRVTDWAGNHHEKLDGTGYPRRLTSEDLSVPERVMAIADVFEALTATDRPYMRPKALGLALRIMRSMCDEGHLCPELFDLFLSSGAYRKYAEQYLQPSQLEEVDISQFLSGSR